MTKKRIRFIINPKSGTTGKKDLPDLIRRSFDADSAEVDIRLTEYALHARTLASEAKAAGYDIIAVAGGDGTVNEAASALTGSDCALAILPLGSGNGLARHLSIPLKTENAIQLIRDGSTSTIDTFMVGGHFGIGTFGLGFDAHVAHLFAASKTRGYATYVRLVLGTFFNYRPVTIQVAIDDNPMELSPFLFTVANSSQFGNNAIIAPMADIRDGILNIAVVDPFPPIAAPGLIYRLIRNTLPHSSLYRGYTAKKLHVVNKAVLKAHIDGEPVEISGDFTVKINPASLRIIVPSAR